MEEDGIRIWMAGKLMQESSSQEGKSQRLIDEADDPKPRLELAVNFT